MGRDEPLKVRFSRWFHHDFYRYSLTATIAKILFELTIWTLVVLVAYGLLSFLPTRGQDLIGPFSTHDALTLGAASYVLNLLKCKTTVSKREL